MAVDAAVVLCDALEPEGPLGSSFRRLGLALVEVADGGEVHEMFKSRRTAGAPRRTRVHKMMIGHAAGTVTNLMSIGVPFTKAVTGVAGRLHRADVVAPDDIVLRNSIVAFLRRETVK
jgi:hypothetical protein